LAKAREQHSGLCKLLRPVVDEVGQAAPQRHRVVVSGWFLGEVLVGQAGEPIPQLQLRATLSTDDGVERREVGGDQVALWK
jgi:hypothetical protein